MACTSTSARTGSASCSTSPWCRARRSACETDRLGDTVSYGDAARLAVEFATGTRFDLIERLAAHIADGLLARMPLERATVTVHKPDAPLGLDFDDVAVTVVARASTLRSYLKRQANSAVCTHRPPVPYRGARPTTTMG